MKVSIERTTNGAVQFLYGADEKPVAFVNSTNVEIKSVTIPVGLPKILQDAIQISMQDGRGSQTILYSDLVNINGAAKPGTVDQVVSLLADQVFNG